MDTGFPRTRSTNGTRSTTGLSPSKLKRLKGLAYSRPRHGYPRLTVLFQREGRPVNHKRIYRIYGEEELLVRTKRRKKQAAEPGER